MEWIDYPSWILSDSCRGAWILMLRGYLALSFRAVLCLDEAPYLFFINLCSDNVLPCQAIRLNTARLRGPFQCQRHSGKPAVATALVEVYFPRISS